mgnify:CR=1 FL=1
MYFWIYSSPFVVMDRSYTYVITSCSLSEYDVYNRFVLHPWVAEHVFVELYLSKKEHIFMLFERKKARRCCVGMANCC